MHKELTNPCASDRSCALLVLQINQSEFLKKASHLAVSWKPESEALPLVCPRTGHIAFPPSALLPASEGNGPGVVLPTWPVNQFC